MEQKLSQNQQVQQSLDSPWADLALLSDFMSKELVKKIEWRDVKLFMAVNHSWQSFFGADAVWKSLLEQQYPYQAESVTKDYFKSFKHFYDLSNGLQCPHKDAAHEGSERVCPCVFKTFITERKNARFIGVARRFTGVKSEYYYCSPTWEDDCPCSSGPTEDRLYRSYPVVCKDCMDFIIDDSYVGQHIGMPEEQMQRLDAEWIHEEFVSLYKFDAIKAIPGSEKYIAIIKDPHQIVLVTFKDKHVHIEPLLQEEELTKLLTLEKPSKPATEGDENDSDDDDNYDAPDDNQPKKFDCVEVSACGKYAAICQVYKTRAFVYNLNDKRVTFTLQRGNYQVRNSSFPLSFFTHEGKTLLIAGKHWNYLEVYDPETGEALRSRDVTGKHLELFWCSLEVSPDQKSACSYGWVWHPVGMLASFSLEDWMTKDIFASENAKMALDSDMWDTAFCFVDNDTVALWTETNLTGIENEIEVVTPYGINTKRQKKSDIVLGYNIKTRHFTRLALPNITFYNIMMIDGYLYSLDKNVGIQVTDPKKNIIFKVKNWTPATLELIHGYNAHTKQFLSRMASNEHATTYLLSHIQRQ